MRVYELSRECLRGGPRGGPVGLPYVPKDLEKFQMAVQRLVLIHLTELEVVLERGKSIKHPVFIIIHSTCLFPSDSSSPIFSASSEKEGLIPGSVIQQSIITLYLHNLTIITVFLILSGDLD